ncbi:MAG: peptidoglycan editing factor PgeF [Nitratireductor sp.]|nr:peptidoglycan editing factor PgeF [Nitratireductor sp.]
MTLPAPFMCDALAQAGRDAAHGIAHGFFTRRGGVSRGIYAGLNVGLGSHDDRAAIIENRRRVAQALGSSIAEPVTVHQVHSPDVAVVDAPCPDENRPHADAVVTATPGLAIGVLTADCGPVLFADGSAGVVGAAHAGWKGATTGVLENTISAMEKLGASRNAIVATLGPVISQKNYEVGPEFVERLEAISPENRQFLTPSIQAGHMLFDLPAYIIARLEAAGVSARWTGHCTYEDEENFFSYRRKTHRGEADYGRQISAIMLRN